MAYKIFILFVFFATVSQAQNKKIDVYLDRDTQNGDVTIFAKNTTKVNYAVLISFSEIKNVQHGIPKTLTKTITPGTVTLLKLKKNVTNNRSISLRYNYSYIKGCIHSKVDKDIVYLIPTPEGIGVKLKLIKKIVSSSESELPENWHIYGFEMRKGDTVFAARRGVISKIQKTNSAEQGNSIYHANRNEVEIMQPDCTFANYKYLDKTLITEGESVLAGQPIGIIRMNNVTKSSILIFSVNHHDIKAKGNKLASENKTIPLLFDIDGEGQKLIENNFYESTHSLKTITQEMKKREIKHYKKK